MEEHLKLFNNPVGLPPPHEAHAKISSQISYIDLKQRCLHPVGQWTVFIGKIITLPVNICLEKDKVEKFIREAPEEDLIRHSNSPCTSPVLQMKT